MMSSFFEFIAHQNTVWRAGKMYANLCIQCFYSFVHLIERFKAVNTLQLFLNLWFAEIILLQNLSIGSTTSSEMGFINDQQINLMFKKPLCALP